MSSVRHPAPAARRSLGFRLLAFLGRLVALAGTVALAIEFGPRGLAAGILFGFVLPWLVALRPGRSLRRDPFRTGNVRLTWRPQLRPWAITCGLVAGVGTSVVLQQYSVSAMTTSLLLKGVVGGLLGGLVLPSITWAFTVRRVNRRLADARPPAAAAFGVLGAFVPALVILLAPAAALAETSGPCTGTFGGRDVASHDSLDEDRAIPLVPEDHVTFTLTGPTAPATARFRLHYGPAWIPVDDRVDGTEVSASALVGDYDWAGAGLYRITAEATLQGGQTCTGAVLIDVGVDPLDTVLGALAMAMAVAGSLGVAGTALHDSADAGTAAKRARAAAAASEPVYPEAGTAGTEPASGPASPGAASPPAEEEPLSTAAALDRVFGSDEPQANPPAGAFDDAARDVAGVGGVGAGAAAALGRRDPADPEDLDAWYPRRPSEAHPEPFQWPEDPPAAGRPEAGSGGVPGPSEAGSGGVPGPSEAGSGGGPGPSEVGQEILEQLTNPESFEHDVPVAPTEDEEEQEPGDRPRP